MADEASVRRFGDAMGVGKVYGPYGNAAAEARDGHARRPTFIWLAEQEAADEAAAALLLLVGAEKRADLIRVCPRADANPETRG